jgi:choline dehydrogenase-like flavoprotein
LTHQRVSGEVLPKIHIDPTSDDTPPMFNSLKRRLLRAAPKLDLWPVGSRSTLSGAAKSYHFGGSFAHRSVPATAGTTDRRGRLDEWSRVHLVDGSVFPSVPSTTFTLTVMANAHRIADEALHDAV